MSPLNFLSTAAGRRHWDIFSELCLKFRATGNLVPDAYFAALAIESGSEWITSDAGFGRYPNLKWRRLPEP
ncbi:MAG: PIN domain-containing protein [Myxococcales bacterium]|nr:PIN domain-containing protein [Myxococcales bacterium]